ncbi:MAG TPA: GTPase [Streptosporangiaceae bacterium]|nr:GTPase [Streptosporangiaceae bacterium]
MTAGGPPWQVFGAEKPGPQTADQADPADPADQTDQADQVAGSPGRARPKRLRARRPVPRAAGAAEVPEPAGIGTAVAGAAGPVTASPGPVQPQPRPEPGGTPLPAPPTATVAGADVTRSTSPVQGLSARLTALARLIQIAGARTEAGGFSEDLLQDARDLVDRAGERLRLSAGHTVVAVAGGTGSGKSSIFNYLAGADFSAVGVTRPVTRDAHACTWGASGSGPLLEWLGVPRRFRYTRGGALDRGDASLNGLILLDLPDHDSVVGGASHQVDRLIGMADLMVWVLDPQKYADAAVHRRYLVPLAGHSEVIAVVLNQSDLLSDAEVEDCVGDLRRLLDSEGLHEAVVLVTSAVTGAGMDQLHGVLAEAVSQRRATASRISADLDGIAAEFAPYAEPPDGPAARQDLAASTAGADRPGGTGRVSSGAIARLVDAFARAVGVRAVAEALQSARELRAVDYVGWPVAWVAERLTGRDPVRKIRLGRLWAEVKSMTAGPTGAQQAEIDKALTKLADEIGPPLPRPWSQTARTAVRSRVGQIPGALGAAMRESTPDENKITPWWRLIGALQGLLLGCVIVSFVWIVVLLIFGVLHASRDVPRLFSDLSLLPWIVVMIAAFLLLGWLTAAGCMNLVRNAAELESEQVQETMREKIENVARELVIEPAEQELAEYQRFRDELRVAAGS